ncbi:MULTISPECIES: thioredoxin family protein [Pseudomonas]|uniref:DUF899 domain-containing protein n=1 Tax=Pseudomonas sessilinigenes TaxID=658629 RepID=A0ABX8MVV5_9PSED|nr:MULTISPECIES: thioredoxin family protein [Pseudomonas]AZC23317.1 hypothetical protein C4K39_1626 [Pseudomonas sessilinigenes]QIH06867.1 DUF899 domain-containing protein [Pseudomonas sp. BIOMIG1BAC]QXH42324.1 DUF899 domain-containing protein [Pseudomonas sessilinigenes]
MDISDHPVVTREQWLEARKQHLLHEKAFTRQRDLLSAERRALPWVRIDKPYRFQGPQGTLSLADLFGGRSQLLVYHFMFGAGWAEGCKGCSFLADHFDGANQHLAHHDIALVAVSHAPYEQFQAFRQRMGWQFDWVSSAGEDFNQDFGVSFSNEQRGTATASYNYAPINSNEEELPGLSVFYRNEQGEIFHTYSTYTRGLDLLIGTYNFLDLAPKGRNEGPIMNWVRHHDRYDDTPSNPKAQGCCCTD